MPDAAPAPAAPPERWFRLADGRTLSWGGPTWQGYWKYGDAVIAAAPVGGDTRGEPVEDGRPLAGGWVNHYGSAHTGPPSGHTPTDTQGSLLRRMPLSEGEARALDGNRQRTLSALSDAGWVYWAGPAGLATLVLTTAGEAAAERNRQARRLRRR